MSLIIKIFVHLLSHTILVKWQLNTMSCITQGCIQVYMSRTRFRFFTELGAVSLNADPSLNCRETVTQIATMGFISLKELLT